jgi:hypothetical protein
LYCDRPDPALSKVLAAFKGTVNPLTSLQTMAKEYGEFKKLVTPVIATVKTLTSKGSVSPEAFKALSEKLSKLKASNEALKRNLARKVDKDGRGGNGNPNPGGKGRKRKPKGGSGAAAAAAADDEEKDEE